MAVSALAFLAAESERLQRFVSVTGLGPHNLRAAAAGPDFHGSVLAYLVGNEQLLLEFASEKGVHPQEVVRALAILEGPHPEP